MAGKVVAFGDSKSAAYEQAKARFRGFRENPAAAAAELFADPSTVSGRLELQPHQVEVARAVLAGDDVTWRAGHGVGKTTTLAVVLFLYLLLHPRCKVPTTAPTWHQVIHVLWSEIAKWYERFRFKEYFHLDKTRLYSVRYPAEWFAIGVASNRQANMEGYHAPHLLYVVDEAKGVRDPIFDAIDGACTEGGQRIYVSTPGGRTGKFYDSHHGRISRLFRVVHTNGESSARVSSKWVEQKRLEWGERSPIYIAKVRGEFPQEGDDVMYPLDWLDEAELAFLEVDADGRPAVAHGGHRAIGCDVSRFGFNQTVSIGGSARRFDRLRAWERAPTTETTANLIALARDMETEDGVAVDVIAVDDTGLGGGVTDQLRDGGYPVEGVLFGASASEDKRDQFANKKAEMAHMLRAALDENRRARAAGQPGTFAVLPHERLKGQLAALRRRYAGKGVLSIVDPDDPSVPASELAPGMKVSPDHAHAAILAYYGAVQAATVGAGAVHHPETRTSTLGQRRLSGYIFGSRTRR